MNPLKAIGKELGEPFLRKLKSGKVIEVRGRLRARQINTPQARVSPTLLKDSFRSTYGDTLIGKTLIERKVPPKRELIKLITQPKQIKDTVDAYALATGKSKKEIYGILGKSLYLVGGKDLAVNSGGLLGSQLGGSLASLPGMLGGDFVGARLTRGLLDRAEAKVIANQRGTTEEARKRLYKRVLKRISKQGKAEREKDTIGWAIGNTTAVLTSGAPLPLRGGALALHSTSPIYKGIKDRSVKTYIKEQKDIIKGVYGGEYEKEARRKADAYLQRTLPEFRKSIRKNLEFLSAKN